MCQENDMRKAYANLVEKIRSTLVDKNTMEKLKKCFADEINSRRRMSQLESLKELIEILEIRHAVDYMNPGPIARIAGFLKDNAMCQEANQYFVQLYKYNLNPKMPPPLEEAEFGLMTAEDLPVTVAEKISTEIGNGWKDFSRALGLKEQEIADIDNSKAKLKDKIEESLMLFTSRSNIFNRHERLLQALQYARRSDLKAQVQRLFFQESFGTSVPALPTS